MDSTFGTFGIVLNRFPVNENDVKAIVYTKDDGKLELIARGAKKMSSKIAGHIETLNFINLMVVKGRHYDYIGSAICLDCFYNIKNDFEKIKDIGETINFFNSAIKVGEPDKKIFELLKSFLETVNKKETDSELLSSFFIFKLLIELGHGPELYNCLSCGSKIKEENNVFDLKQGGLTCQKCLRRPGKNYQLTVSPECIKVLRLIKNSDINKFNLKIKQKEKNDILKIISSLEKYISC